MIYEPSVKSLRLVFCFEDTELATGTGFIVSKGMRHYLITNRHNVTGRDQISDKPMRPDCGTPNRVIIRHNKLDRLGEWIEKSEDLYLDDRERWIEHPVGLANFDFVALPLNDVVGAHLYSYDPNNVGPLIRCGPSDTVSVVGYPFGLTGGDLAIWATGFVASETAFDQEPIFLIDCRTRRGQSGSAVISFTSGGMVAMNDDSAAAYSGPVYRFLGIYSGRINKDSDLRVVWKASVIAELFRAIG